MFFNHQNTHLNVIHWTSSTPRVKQHIIKCDFTLSELKNQPMWDGNSVFHTLLYIGGLAMREKKLFLPHIWWSKTLKSNFLICWIILGGLEAQWVTFRWVFWWLKNKCPNYSIVRFHYMWKTPYFHSLLSNFDYLKG